MTSHARGVTGAWCDGAVRRAHDVEAGVAAQNPLLRADARKGAALDCPHKRAPREVGERAPQLVGGGNRARDRVDVIGLAPALLSMCVERRPHGGHEVNVDAQDGSKVIEQA